MSSAPEKVGGVWKRCSSAYAPLQNVHAATAHSDAASAGSASHMSRNLPRGEDIGKRLSQVERASAVFANTSRAMFMIETTMPD